MAMLVSPILLITVHPATIVLRGHHQLLQQLLIAKLVSTVLKEPVLLRIARSDSTKITLNKENATHALKDIIVYWESKPYALLAIHVLENKIKQL